MMKLERLVGRIKSRRQARRARRAARAMRLVLGILEWIFGLAALAALVVGVLYLSSNYATDTMVTSKGERRRYILYVPEIYDPQVPTPLVISIHGYSDWPEHHAEMTGWNVLADEHGFLVVYPAGMKFPRRWRSSGATFDDPLHDVIFISELIDKLEGEYNIDQERIYANGLSNGAGMSFLLACEMPDRIAAVGLVAGAYLLPWEACTPARAVPTVVFHGTADPIVPFEGGPSEAFNVPFPNIPEWVDTLARQNGCMGETETVMSGQVREKRYTGCTADVVYYEIEGGGHTWPGGEPLPVWLTGETSDEIEATRVIWAFYEANHR